MRSRPEAPPCRAPCPRGRPRRAAAVPPAGSMREHAGRRHSKRPARHPRVQSDALSHRDRLTADHAARWSKPRATSTPWVYQQEGARRAYAAAVSDSSTRVGSPPSSAPTYTPRVAELPNPTKKRKWRPSGRNCGQRWLAWPAASRVTATGVPPVAATRISGLKAVGANG